MSYASAEHDRMLAGVVIKGYVVAVDLATDVRRYRLEQCLGALALVGCR